MQAKAHKTALVTGGARRLGSAIALWLAQQGYNIYLHYRHSEDEAHMTAERIEQLGSSCRLLQADFEKANELIQMWHLMRKYGLPEIIIHNASLFVPSPETDEGDLRLLTRHWNVHVAAPYLLTTLYGRYSNSGLVIFLLDTRIQTIDTQYFEYWLSKRNSADLVRGLAKKLAPSIRVNGIAPGPILPPDGKDQQYLQQKANELPLQQHGGFEDIAHALNYLIVSKFVTGEILYVDGGAHLR